MDHTLSFHTKNTRHHLCGLSPVKFDGKVLGAPLFWQDTYVAPTIRQILGTPLLLGG